MITGAAGTAETVTWACAPLLLVPSRASGGPSGRGSRLREGGKSIYKATRDAGVMNTAAADAPKAGSGGGGRRSLLCSRGTFSVSLASSALLGGTCGCGLLEPGSLEAMPCGELRRRRTDRLFEAADQFAALPEPPLTEQELEVEIQAARAGRATHAGGR